MVVRRRPSLPILDLSKASLQTILNKRAQIKNATYVPLLNVPFSPLVLSLGGTVENALLEAMEAWKEVVRLGNQVISS
jgi:hypothetical protein